MIPFEDPFLAHGRRRSVRPAGVVYVSLLLVRSCVALCLENNQMRLRSAAILIPR
jgi:hypothetical protein